MSYILDALKKANAERALERGAAPGIHTQPIRSISASSARVVAGTKKRHALLLALGAALVLCAMTLGALFWSTLATPPVERPTLNSSASPPAAVPPHVEGQHSTRPIPANTVATPTSSEAKSAPQSRIISSRGDRVTPQTPNTVQPESANKQLPGEAGNKRARPTESPHTNPSNQEPIPLPASVKNALPPLVISGSTYSDNPSHRMLIINGHVYHEGESPLPELKLERIHQKSAVLMYLGTPYTIGY